MSKKEKQQGKPSGPVVAALIAGSLSLLTISILNLLSFSNQSFASFLTFIKPLGSLSGKIILGYSLGLLVYFVLRQVLLEKNPSLFIWGFLFFVSLLLSVLFVFPPLVFILMN